MNLYYVLKNDTTFYFCYAESLETVKKFIKERYTSLPHGHAFIYGLDGKLLESVTYCSSNQRDKHAQCQAYEPKLVIHYHGDSSAYHVPYKKEKIKGELKVTVPLKAIAWRVVS